MNKITFQMGNNYTMSFIQVNFLDQKGEMVLIIGANLVLKSCLQNKIC